VIDMYDDEVRFTAIKGIGKRADSRLHEAGVATWQSLADVLAAMSTIREASSERLGEMGRQAAKRASRSRAAATTEARDVERPYGFVVEITFDPTGHALRSSVTDVRAERDQQWAGWEPASLLRFIEHQTGLDAPRPRVTTRAPARKRTTGRRRPAARPVVPSADAATELPPSTVTLGRTIGGGRRTVDFVVELAKTGKKRASVRTLDAQLGLRALGQSSVKELARTSATTAERELTLEFAGVDIPPGVHNLVVELLVDGQVDGTPPTVRDVRVA
jgi:hypothetical protein